MGPKQGSAGFSLIELLIAMIVTMIIGGAIVAMLIGGQDAFKVQPEVSDFQQNGRSALDMIMRDVVSAGSGVPANVQVFKIEDGGVKPGDPIYKLNGMGDVAPSGVNTDELEVMYDTSGLGAIPVCGNPGKSAILRIDRPDSPIQTDQVITVFMHDGTWTVRQVTKTAANNGNNCLGKCNNKHGTDDDVEGVSDCTGTTTLSCTEQCQDISSDDKLKREQLNMASSGDAAKYNPNGGSGPKVCQKSPSGIGTVDGGKDDCMPEYIVMSDIIRYRIFVDETGVPYLQRRSMLEGNKWRSVARGIEDLQVRYRSQGKGWQDSPDKIGQLADGTLDYTTLTLEVEVSLSARSEMLNAKGAVFPVDVNGDPVYTEPARLRATFVSHVAPRATLYAAAQSTATTVWQ